MPECLGGTSQVRESGRRPKPSKTVLHEVARDQVLGPWNGGGMQTHCVPNVFPLAVKLRDQGGQGPISPTNT